MSYSVGGFSGGDALLAFAAIQQGRMNEEMTQAMQDADLRAQMASDLADIKSHLEVMNRHPEAPEQFQAVDDELQAFMAKYGENPALEEVTSSIGEIAKNIHDRRDQYERQHSEAMQTWGGSNASAVAQGYEGFDPPKLSFAAPGAEHVYAPESIKSWLDQITEKLSASGTNDQLAMIHIKQLNDNINNSSGMVSGIIESRNNSTASIINNIA